MSLVVRKWVDFFWKELRWDFYSHSFLMLWYFSDFNHLLFFYLFVLSVAFVILYFGFYVCFLRNFFSLTNLLSHVSFYLLTFLCSKTHLGFFSRHCSRHFSRHLCQFEKVSIVHIGPKTLLSPNLVIAQRCLSPNLDMYEGVFGHYTAPHSPYSCMN